MTVHKIGTREEWLSARLLLLEAEKELTQCGDELTKWRQKLPWVRIDKQYRFETDEGTVHFDLFRRHSQLLVYHFMFGPEYTGGCTACSAIADGFTFHLEHHDVAMIVVSRAPIAAIRDYKRRMGWTSTWPSRWIAISTTALTYPLLKNSSGLTASITIIAYSHRNPTRAAMTRFDRASIYDPRNPGQAITRP
jgi:predicted dithiol-disulfide oxidoreductase (DUF899 family)